MNDDKILLADELKRFVSLRYMWQALTGNNKQVFEFSLSIDTEIDKNITITGSGPLRWPHLVGKSSAHTPPILYFPLTIIGNKSVSYEERPISFHVPWLPYFVGIIFWSS